MPRQFIQRRRRRLPIFFGQYTAEDIEMTPGMDYWTGSIYDPGMVPSAWTTEWARKEYQPGVLSQLKLFWENNKMVSIAGLAAIGLLFFGKKIRR